MNTGEIIGKLAKERGMNLRQLALKADVPYNTLYAIVKRNSARVSTHVIHQVALSLEVPDHMLYSDGDENKVADPERGPETDRIQNRLESLEQVALISYLFTVSLPKIYPDMPDESKKRIAVSRRRLLVRAKTLCSETPLTDEDRSAYHTGTLTREYQQSIQKAELEDSVGYETWLRHISEFVCRYASLNADGRKELEKRLDELERLKEYEDPILTAEVKNTIETSIK